MELPKSSPLGSINPFHVPPSPSTLPAPFRQVQDALRSMQYRRLKLGMANPGAFENVNREVAKDVFISNYFFTGLRGDLTKSFSMNPAFQVSHSFSVGSPMMPSYGLAALYATDDFFLQGNIDKDYSLSGRANYGWSKDSISKANVQVVPDQPTMVQLEHDYHGHDFTANLKILNPSVLRGGFTGIAVGSWLQSITKKLALGLECAYSAPSTSYPPDAAVNYVARYASNDWVASAQLNGAQGSLVTSFYRKVTDHVDAGVESTVGVSQAAQQALMMGQPTSSALEGVTTIGARYEFRQSVFRGQIDSNDHSSDSARIGMGLQLESGGEEAFESSGGSMAKPPM